MNETWNASAMMVKAEYIYILEKTDIVRGKDCLRITVVRKMISAKTVISSISDDSVV
jgi:hypothetical protein